MILLLFLFSETRINFTGVGETGCGVDGRARGRGGDLIPVPDTDDPAVLLCLHYRVQTRVRNRTAVAGGGRVS